MGINARYNFLSLCDVIKHSVASLLVVQPLANEDAGGGGVELAAPQHAMAVTHVILKRPLVHFSCGIPAIMHTHTQILVMNL